MRKNKINSKNWVFLFTAILLYIPLGFLQVSIDYNKKLENLESGLLLMPGQVAGSLVLSGFKGLAADLLWLNIENYWHEGQHYKMLPLLESIAWLQPQYVTVWSVGGWHMSYNIFAQVKINKENLIEEYKEKVKNLPEKDKKDLHNIIKIGEKLNFLIENLGLKEGMEEDRITKLLTELGNYQYFLDNYKVNEENKFFIDALKEFIGIVDEMLYWYNQGIEFLKKGVAYNPEKYDLYFELGWTYYHKGKDYKNAVRYLEKAIKFPHPDYVDDVLAHAYEKNGQIDLAMKQWEKLLNTGFKSIAERAIQELETKGKFTP
ncbi:MAG TPA: tetratricopeptide repeat protein [bacterium]|nr:tetratricopeptide repeat protein [bacterium]